MSTPHPAPGLLATPPTGTSGADLAAFCTHLRDAGLVTQHTGEAYRLAVRRVLSTRPGWQHTDVTGLDLDETIERFTRAHQGDLAEATIGQYASGFRRAHALFTAHRANPTAWRPPPLRRPRTGTRPIRPADRTLRIPLARGRRIRRPFPPT